MICTVGVSILRKSVIRRPRVEELPTRIQNRRLDIILLFMCACLRSAITHLESTVKCVEYIAEETGICLGWFRCKKICFKVECVRYCNATLVQRLKKDTGRIDFLFAMRLLVEDQSAIRRIYCPFCPRTFIARLEINVVKSESEG